MKRKLALALALALAVALTACSKPAEPTPGTEGIYTPGT